MRLKQLQMQGYKTFANKTDFIFDSGITTIVGPNGSGKSNVADAIRWVLGEQSYSELRGKRTVDMIFNGSQSRAQAGMAVATITLDNSDGWLPVDYNEVEISRRAYRSGENEYYLNGQKVRLRDIRELLATSGLAQRTYTMIGQGLIDRALSLKAEERRALFEEAAGIQHYKTRRAESLRRLHETQRNIERVQDVLGELQPRLRSLKRQAQRAQDYEQVQTDLRQLLRIWYGFQWEKSQTVLRDRRAVSNKAETAWKAGRRAVAELQEGLDEKRQAVNRLNAAIGEKAAERDGLRERVEQGRRQVAILTERKESVSRQLADIDTELPELERLFSQSQSEMRLAMADLEAAQTNLKSEQASLERFESSVDGPQAEIVQMQKTAAESEQAVQIAQRKLSQSEGVLSQLQERLERLLGESNRSATSATDADANKLTSLRDTITTMQTELTGLTEKRQAAVNERRDVITHLKQARRERHDAERERNKLTKQIARLEERLVLLDDLRKVSAESSSSAKISGRLADIVSVSAEHKTALMAALDSRLDTLIVPDGKNLLKLLNESEQVTAVSEDNLGLLDGDLTSEGVIGRATDVCDFTPDKRALVMALLNHIWLVDSIANGRDAVTHLPNGHVAVAPDGTIFHKNGLVEKRVPSAENALKREEAWRNAQAELDGLNEQVTAGEKDWSEQGDSIDKAQARTDELGETINSLQQQEQTVRQKLGSANRDADRLEQTTRYQQKQAEQSKNEVAGLKDRIQKLSESRDAHGQELRTVENRLETARLKLETLPVGEVRQQKGQLQQQIQAVRTIVEGRRAVVDSRKATMIQMETRLQRQRDRAETLRREAAQINLETAQKGLDRDSAAMERLLADLKPLREERGQLQTTLTDLESDLITRQREAQKQDSDYTEARLAFNQQENAIENLSERIRADLGFVTLINNINEDDEAVQEPLPLAEVVQRLPQVDSLPDGIDISIQKRRGQIQRMGAINPDAPQEYAEAQERVDFLTQQIEDLHQTEEKLRGVIAELDTLTGQEFGKTVEKVNTVFARIFTQLFGGGTAELVLTNPDDLTITGVDIMAQLPRRRMQGLGLLSGGERALTGAALIFALLTVSPPPFCVMDEVDAALDEANINRFREALLDLRELIQFIVITHNRGTVRAANTIYGISMGSDSVSQVISIKPEDYVTVDD